MLGKQLYQPKLFSTIQIESLIPKNHLLRKLDETLDLGFIRDEVESLYSKGTGRPSVDPETFIRMLLIEYLYNIESDRQLCEEIGYNLAYRWFCRFSLEDDVPDHSSMTRIRDRLGEETFQKIFVHIVRLCEEKGLVKGKRVMTDGSYIKADAALKSLTDRDPETGAPKPKPESKDDDDSGPQSSGGGPSKSIKGKKFSNKTHVSQTDPESTLAGKDSEPKQLRYKIHQSCDADSRVIVDCAITTGAITDGTVYIERLEKIQETLQIKIEEAIADRGYGYGENLQHLKSKGIRSFVPRFRPTDKPQYEKSKWYYDEATDRFFCLAKVTPLYPRGKIDKGGLKLYRDIGSTCRRCSHRFSCFKVKGGLRVNVHHQVIQAAHEMEQTPEYKERRRERMWKIEGLFAEGKFFHGLDRARYRGKWKVQVQAYMTASVQNLKRLMAAVLWHLARLEFFGVRIFDIEVVPSSSRNFFALMPAVT